MTWIAVGKLCLHELQGTVFQSIQALSDLWMELARALVSASRSGVRPTKTIKESITLNSILPHISLQVESFHSYKNKRNTIIGGFFIL